MTKRKKDSNQANMPGMYPAYLSSIEKEIAGKYRFDSAISLGNTRATYKIINVINSAPYCLKTVKEGLDATTFQRTKDAIAKEVEVLLPIRHNCVPSVYEHNVTCQLPYYICTYHPGMTFSAFCEAKKTLDVDESVFVVMLLIDAFEYLHSQGRTHCDLHAKNVLISEEVFKDGILRIMMGRDIENLILLPAPRTEET